MPHPFKKVMRNVFLFLSISLSSKNNDAESNIEEGDIDRLKIHNHKKQISLQPK